MNDSEVMQFLKNAFRAGWDARDKKSVPAQQLNNVEGPYKDLIDVDGTVDMEFDSYCASLAAKLKGPEEPGAYTLQISCTVTRPTAEFEINEQSGLKYTQAHQLLINVYDETVDRASSLLNAAYEGARKAGR